MSTKAIAKKLVAVATKLEAVEKRGTNEFSNYKYAKASDIFALVRDQLQEQGVAFTWSTDDAHVVYPKEDGSVRDIKVNGAYEFTDIETGEVITGDWQGFASDKGDKALWKAITGALKYVFISTFLLPTEDDPENDSGERAAKAEATKRPQPPKAEPVKTERVGLTNPQKAKLAATLRELGITSTDQRHMFILTATGKHKTDEMTQADFDKALAEATPGSQAVSNALAVA